MAEKPIPLCGAEVDWLRTRYGIWVVRRVLEIDHYLNEFSEPAVRLHILREIEQTYQARAGKDAWEEQSLRACAVWRLMQQLDHWD
jgi:hypothetical protein